MNTLMKTSNGNVPARSLSGMVDKLFQNNLNRFFNDDFWDSQVQQSSLAPVNITQTDSSYELELVAPGLKKEELKVNVANGLLTISYDEDEKQREERNGMIREEYKRRSFSRSFNLDDTLDVNKITATYVDGILKLSIPVREDSKPLSRIIQIK